MNMRVKTTTIRVAEKASTTRETQWCEGKTNNKSNKIIRLINSRTLTH